MDKKLWAAAALAMGLCASACGGDEQPAPYNGARVPVRVMTRNLYLGSDITDVVRAPTPEDVPARAAAFWANVVRSDFPNRAKLLAAEIVAADPDLVGLQEVEMFRQQAPSDFAVAPGVNAVDVVYDFLAMLQDELVASGADYRVLASNTLSDVELPAALPDGTVDLRMTDRDVVLGKPSVVAGAPSNIVFDTFVGGNIGNMSGPRIEIKRGRTTLPVTVNHANGAASFTFGNAHLEVGGILADYQEAQADDLVKEMKPVRGPIVFVGDFNSAADRSGTRSYGFLRTVLDDPWMQLRATDPGATCCIDIFAPSAAGASTRIDLVLTRGDVVPVDAAMVGATATTPKGIAASDHLGVVMTLGLVPDAAR